ncbi:hypothetical protein F4X10_18400 [Candidatus Poribacteria bacterium]|nr:hypothetical protein [Candidatus Poribacteria bacterium]
MRLRSYRVFSLLLFYALVFGTVEVSFAQGAKERVGRHSPAYMRSVLYLYNNVVLNSDHIVYLGKSKNKKALFGGTNIRHAHGAFDMDLYDYQGLVKRQPKIETYAEIEHAMGTRSTIVVLSIVGVDVSRYKAITPELYPFDKEGPDIKVLYYAGRGKNKDLLAISCKGFPPKKVHLELNFAPIDFGNEGLGHSTKPAFNPDTGNLYGLAFNETVSSFTPKFIQWVKDQTVLAVSSRDNLTTSWGALKKGSDFSAP